MEIDKAKPEETPVRSNPNMFSDLYKPKPQLSKKLSSSIFGGTKNKVATKAPAPNPNAGGLFKHLMGKATEHWEQEKAKKEAEAKQIA